MAEFVFTVVSAVLELCLYFILASIRPWRYALSPGYRATVDADLAGRGAIYRTIFFGWGSLVLLLGLGGLSLPIWFFFLQQPAPEEPGAREKLIRQVERVLVEQAANHRDGK